MDTVKNIFKKTNKMQYLVVNMGMQSRVIGISEMQN